MEAICKLKKDMFYWCSVHKKEFTYYTVVSAIAIIYILYMLPNITPVFFSDGVPMAHRVYRFKTGDISIGEYFFTAHGNALHVLIYFAALLDSFLFMNMPIIQIACVCIGMVGAAMFFSYILYSSENSLFRNIALSLSAMLFLIGGYNFDMYLSFQMVLTFSRLLFLLSFILVIKTFDKTEENKNWIWCTCFATLVALSHGIGLVFAAAYFYIHIVYKRPIKQIIGSLLPAVFFLVLQIGYNKGLGEVSMVSGTLSLEQVIIFLKGVAAYYGGFIYMFFGFPYRLCLLIGGILWGIISVILLGFFIYGLNLDCLLKIKGNELDRLFKELTIKKGVWLAVIGMSYLSSFGATAYVMARAELVHTDLGSAIKEVIDCGRYLNFGIMPYIYILKEIFHFFDCIRIRKAVSVISGAIVVFIFIQCSAGTQRTIDRNRELDYSGCALLAGVDVHCPVAENIFYGFEKDWYWKDQVPILIDYLRKNDLYLWSMGPGIGDYVGEAENSLLLSDYKFYDFNDTHFEIEGIVSKQPTKRFLPIIDENKIVVGFMVKIAGRGLYWKQDNGIYYNDLIILKGFIDKSQVSTGQLYIVE